MTKGWLAAAILVMISASTFDLQMLERPVPDQVQAGLTRTPGQYTPAGAPAQLVATDATDTSLDTHPLQAGLQSYPDNLLADTAAACALDAPQVSEASLARCYQARLEASTDKDFRVWEGLNRRLSTSSGGQLAEIVPMAARVTGQALEQG